MTDAGRASPSTGHHRVDARHWLAVVALLVGCGASTAGGGRDAATGDDRGSPSEAGPVVEDAAPAGDAPGPDGPEGGAAVDGPEADRSEDGAADVPGGDPSDGGASDVPVGADASSDGAGAAWVDAGQGDAAVCEVVRTLSASQSLTYAPMATGDRWTYQGRWWLTSVPDYLVEYQQRLEVTGRKMLNGTDAFVISDSSPDSNPSPAEEYYAVSAAGLVNEGVMATGNSPPGTYPPAAPYTQVQFPIRVCSAFQQFRATTSSGKVTSTSVARALETATVSGITFPDALRVETSVTTETPTADGGPPQERASSNTVDWYAAGFGRIKRTVQLSDREFQWDLTGALIDGVGHGVLPGGTIAQVDGYTSFLGGDDRPAIASDGQNFLVVTSNSSDLYTGGLAAILVGPDGKTIKATPVVQGGRVPQSPAMAYGGGRYLVAYPTWNSTTKAVMLMADGTQIGPAFDIRISGSVAVAYGAGVFLVASTQSTNLGISVVNSQGAVTSEATPYPGQRPKGSPALAFDGSNFLMVWLNTTDELPNGQSTRVSAGRVNADGNALDLAITQVTSTASFQESVDVAFDGTRHVISWFHRTSPSLVGEGEVRIARLGTDGVLLDPGGRVVAPARYGESKLHPRIARLGGQTVVVWERSNFQTRGPAYWIAATRVDPNGNSLDVSDVADGLYASSGTSGQTIMPAIGWGGDRALLVYLDRFGESTMKRKVDASLLFPW